MTRDSYLNITGKLRGNPKRVRIIKGINRILTGFVFLIYPLFLLVLFLEKHTFLVRAVLVPAVSFLLVTCLRQVMNVPRPYERFAIPPVLDKDTKGKSFPSRHVFSVFVIAMTVYYTQPGAGIMLGMVGAFLGIIRVFGGVHQPRDIIAGALAGIVCGLIGYYVI